MQLNQNNGQHYKTSIKVHIGSNQELSNLAQGPLDRRQIMPGTEKPDRFSGLVMP